MTFLTNSPLAFDFDQHTGILWVKADTSFGRRNPVSGEEEELHIPVSLGLTPGTSRSLLAVLPHLETLLRRAAEGPAKPRSVQ